MTDTSAYTLYLKVDSSIRAVEADSCKPLQASSSVDLQQLLPRINVSHLNVNYNVNGMCLKSLTVKIGDSRLEETSNEYTPDVFPRHL